ncbi:MAG: hypothetical protein IIT76_07345, partial [Prevotella sp.]|nr:hypothetical protein [Prevotella sp.]
TETQRLRVYLLPFLAFGEAGCDNYGKLPTGCYNTALFVSTTAGEILEKSWNGLKSVITLHRQSDLSGSHKLGKRRKPKRKKRDL